VLALLNLQYAITGPLAADLTDRPGLKTWTARNGSCVPEASEALTNPYIGARPEVARMSPDVAMAR
jgi:hypothetical protein